MQGVLSTQWGAFGGEIMNKYEKILIVLLLGSLWGAVELFGRDFLLAAGFAQKGAILFGLGIIILYASKRLVDFPGTVVVMALIAGLFKTASSNFFICQFAAVMINGIIFDIAYTAFKGRLDSSPVYRTVAAPIIAYASYAAFALIATFVIRDSVWVSDGWAGIGTYLSVDAVVASAISLVTINVGYYLGNAIQPHVVLRKLGLPGVSFQVVSVVLVAVLWVAGQIY
jgi:hypothetical protein